MKSIIDLLNILKKERIKTWFDLNKFIKTIQENHRFSPNELLYLNKEKEIEFKHIAFITFHYGVDGVSIEICKYLKIINELFNNIEIHLIGGEFSETFKQINNINYKCFIVNEINGFSKWKYFNTFYKTKLIRDSEIYNNLAINIWNEIQVISKKIGEYLLENKIQLIYLVNTNSNPGNISLSISNVIISEYLKIPVISNNHDFFWEGGNIQNVNNSKLKLKTRDHFFTNFTLKEIFSIIEITCPWSSKYWFSLNINLEQSKRLINKYEHSKDSVGEISTAIDTENYKPLSDEIRKKEIFNQISKILSGYKNDLKVYSLRNVNSLKNNYIYKPFLLGLENNNLIDISYKDLIFLQPTRITDRKKIEVNFFLLKKLFEQRNFIQLYLKNQIANILIIVTGPITAGHKNYFHFLIENFIKILKEIDSEYQKKIFLGFLFSEFDKITFKKRFKKPIKIYDLYKVSSLITLPSETEGRGLPIIEGASCEKPVFARRYYPEKVFSDVIGEHLSTDQRLNIIEFQKKINDITVYKLIEFLFTNKNEIMKNNRQIVKKRYNMNTLKNCIKETLLYTFSRAYY
ncbi:MAG: glycosyltransferase [Candidatus Cloacimonetes bacterium]|nr:glycosyltransferase [Candidatus Cloacimonadota bacterium]